MLCVCFLCSFSLGETFVSFHFHDFFCLIGFFVFWHLRLFLQAFFDTRFFLRFLQVEGNFKSLQPNQGEVDVQVCSTQRRPFALPRE